MEENTTGVRTVNKRLLSFRQLVRQAFIVYYCCLSVAVYAQQVSGAVELRIYGDVFFIDRDVEIEVIIKNTFSYLKQNSDMPHLIFREDPAVVQLIQSSILPEQDGLHICSRYRFTQTGRLVLLPTLQWKRQVFNLEPVNVTVHQPPLSEHTKFFWILCSADGDILSDEAVPEQGTEYILCLNAAFYSSGYDGQYIQALQTASAVRHGKPAESTAARVAASGGVPLPPEIARIECAPAENAALAPLELQDFPSDTAAAQSAGEQYCLAAFRWIPLQTGIQALPQAQVHFTSGSKAAGIPRSYRVEPSDTAITGESGHSQTFTAAAFAEVIQGLEGSSSDMTGQEEIAAAKKIAEYRRQEQQSFFAIAVRQERKKLEAALGIVQPLPLYPRIFGIAAAAVTCLLIAGTVWYRLRSKKRTALLLAILALCCGCGSAVLFYQALKPQAVCIAYNEDAAIRRIPDITGSIVRTLVPGESVLIIRKTAQWYYVRTAGGFSGWVLRHSLIELNPI